MSSKTPIIEAEKWAVKNTEMRRAPIPFDPDSIGGAAITVAAAPMGETMLSEVIAQSEWDMPEAGALGDGPGTSRPLDKMAKFRLSELAGRAFEMLKARGLLAGEDLKGYRGRIAMAACGRRISQACLGDRMKIQAAFLHEMDRAEEAGRCAMKAMGTAKDIALHKLKELCVKKQFPKAYAEGVAWRVFKMTLEDLNAKQVWAVFFTLNNNASKRDGKGCEANRWKKLKGQRNAKKSY